MNLREIRCGRKAVKLWDNIPLRNNSPTPAENAKVFI
jgi:hypothetical protein